MTARTISLRGGMFDVEVHEGGSGDPLLYLHGIGGPGWSEALERLSGRHRVIAPSTPGFGGSTGGSRLHDIHDLVYFYLDMLDELGLRNLPVVGHSLGGMIAAELAAVQPDRFTKVVLIAPLGIWNEDHPVLDFFSVPTAELARAMYHNQELEAAVAVATAPQARMTEVDPNTTEGQATIAYYVERAKSMSTVARYLWPIPDRGLIRRLHRVTQPVLLIWGQYDGICPPQYAGDFRAHIPQAQVEIVPNAAHTVPYEDPEHTAGLINRFLVTR